MILHVANSCQKILSIILLHFLNREQHFEVSHARVGKRGKIRGQNSPSSVVCKSEDAGRTEEADKCWHEDKAAASTPRPSLLTDSNALCDYGSHKNLENALIKTYRCESLLSYVVIN